MQTTDYLIIGAGMVGLTIARELQRRDPRATVTVVDKEPALGRHASGRNSGVLHSGIYYPSDTLKTRFTREGNQAWQAYCQEKKIPIDRCGKLIVARNAKEHEQLQTLEQRASANGVEVHRLDLNQVRELESRAKTFQEALFVPSTATPNPLQLLAAQQEDFIQAGGVLKLDAAYRRKEAGHQVLVRQDWISAGKVINCAGLYADQVAHDFGFGLRYTLLPFKGLYHYASRESQPPRCHIYPVPNLKHPFLGVHFTRTLDGRTKIGPTAIPALWREHYDGFSGFDAKELTEVTGRELHMLVTNPSQFRSLAWQEIRKYRRKNMIDDAATLMEGTEAMAFNEVGRPGIRAQLVERRTNALVMDFVVEGDAHSTHVLNAISPAWTCALPFAQHVKHGRLNPNPNMVFERTAAATGTLDADHTFGHAAGVEAMKHAIELARESGIGAVSVRNSSHCGALSYFAHAAAEQDMIGMAFTHATARVKAPGSSRAFFGNNPLFRD